MANIQLKDQIVNKIMKSKHLSYAEAEKEFLRLTKDVPEKDWGKVAGGMGTVGAAAGGNPALRPKGPLVER